MEEGELVEGVESGEEGEGGREGHTQPPLPS